MKDIFSKKFPFTFMGVVNLTPDSFSDGGEVNSLRQLEDRVALFNKLSVDSYVLDIGAESTAPINSQVDEGLEISRFEKVLVPYLLDYKLPLPKTISIDTYKPETFRFIYEVIKRSGRDIKVLWNDVSGVIDDELLRNLKESFKDVYYVYCHNNVVSRDQTPKHMDKVSPLMDYDFFESVISYFEDAIYMFKSEKLLERVIFDPALGFSKSTKQNHYLIGSLKKLILSFAPDIPWMLGFSRKSFFKKLVKFDTESSPSVVQTEYMQSVALSMLYRPLAARKTIVRLHDPAVFDAFHSIVTTCYS